MRRRRRASVAVGLNGERGGRHLGRRPGFQPGPSRGEPDTIDQRLLGDKADDRPVRTDPRHRGSSTPRPGRPLWPEFGQAGKGADRGAGVAGAHVGPVGLGGAAGPRGARRLGALHLVARGQEPWLGSRHDASGYHAVTQGIPRRRARSPHHGPLARPVLQGDRRRPAGPRFPTGLPPDADVRVAPLIPPPPVDLRCNRVSKLGVARSPTRRSPGEVTAEEWWRRAEIPAANGHGNARSVAKVQSIVACGGERREARG